jgi:hypothetical protein
MAHIKLKYVNAFANRGRKDKRVRYYFRRRGAKAIPLPGLPSRAAGSSWSRSRASARRWRTTGRTMRRLAEAGATAHELMAISGHKTLTEVQRYTKDADRKKLADSGIAKLRGQSENTNVTNIEPPLHKQGTKLLKTKGG